MPDIRRLMISHAILIAILGHSSTIFINAPKWKRVNENGFGNIVHHSFELRKYRMTRSRVCVKWLSWKANAMKWMRLVRRQCWKFCMLKLKFETSNCYLYRYLCSFFVVRFACRDACILPISSWCKYGRQIRLRRKLASILNKFLGPNNISVCVVFFALVTQPRLFYMQHTNELWHNFLLAIFITCDVRLAYRLCGSYHTTSFYLSLSHSFSFHSTVSVWLCKRGKLVHCTRYVLVGTFAHFSYLI